MCLVKGKQKQNDIHIEKEWSKMKRNSSGREVWTTCCKEMKDMVNDLVISLSLVPFFGALQGDHIAE
eukprot:m.14980 g.14980  ORF g.14980 m.14980 type:complete len:67 (-) comp7759_c0_seq1:44-244(-)